MQAPTPVFGRRSLPFDGRIEKRSLAVVPVYLVTAEEPRSSERVFTRNVSPHGARLVSKRLWRPGEEPFLTPTTGESAQPARVVYCHPRSEGGFYVGVQFSERSVQWPDSAST
jgi:PilZ domain